MSFNFSIVKGKPYLEDGETLILVGEKKEKPAVREMRIFTQEYFDQFDQGSTLIKEDRWLNRLSGVAQ